MTVRDAMTPSPLTVTRSARHPFPYPLGSPSAHLATPRTTVATALRLLRDNGIAHLPVLEGGHVLGVVRTPALLALTPSEATTLSRHEATDLLSRLTVGRAVEPTLTLDAATPLADAGRAVLERGGLIADADSGATSPR